MSRLPRLNPLAALLVAGGLLATCLPVVAQTATDAAAKKDAGQEIVVTAQKIKQLASKTSVALTAVNGEALKDAGITDIRGMTELVPNVQISQESGRNLINIRGVMAVDTTERGDPSNAFHLDGIYIGRPEAQLGAFMDLERVEVLRGPQGTLYGKNATGGAINVIANKPVFKREGKASIDIGNYSAVRTEGVFNEKLSETLALRVAFTTTKHDTYLKKGDQTEPLENQDDNAFRLSALWKLGPNNNLLIAGEHSAQQGIGFTTLPIRNFYDGVGVGSGVTQALPDNIVDPVFADRGTDAALTLGGGSAWLRKTQKNNQHDMLRAEYNHDFGWAALTYQFGYLESKLDFDIAGAAASAAPGGGGIIGITKMPVEQSSHELRLASAQSGALRWVAGLFHMDEKIKLRRQFLIDPPDTNPPIFNFTFANKVENKADAVFGQATWSVLPSTRLILGARSSKDSKNFETYNPSTGATTGIREVEFTKSTYRVGAEQDLPGNVFGYVTYSTGYKAGGFNDAIATSPVIRPENLKALEAGVKGRFFGDTLQLSAAIYKYDYKDMQVRGVYCITPVSCGAALTLNGEGATIQGAELEGRLRLSPLDVVTFAAGYNDATFDRFLSRNAAGAVTWDISGQQLDRAPKTTAMVGYSHDFTFAGGASLRAGLSTKYTSRYLNSSYSATAVFRYPQKAFTKTDLLFTYTPAVGDYYAQLYVKNLENKVQVVNVLQGAVNVSAPRTFGVRVGVSF